MEDDSRFLWPSSENLNFTDLNICSYDLNVHFSIKLLILSWLKFQIWWHGAQHGSRQNDWWRLLLVRSLGHRPSRPRHCVEFLSHLSPEPTLRQAKSPKGKKNVQFHRYVNDFEFWKGSIWLRSNHYPFGKLSLGVLKVTKRQTFLDVGSKPLFDIKFEIDRLLSYYSIEYSRAASILRILRDNFTAT